MSLKHTLEQIIVGATIIGASLVPAAGNAAIAATLQTATTNVNVTTSAFVVLSYFDVINLTFNAPAIGTDKIAAKTLAGVSWNGGDASSTQDAAITPTTPGSTKVNLTLQNAWAVRGLTPSGNAKVSIGQTATNLVNGTSTIAMSGYKVSSGSIPAAASINAPLSGLTASTKGNVEVVLDFAATTVAGQHTGGTFVITAESI